MRGAGVLRLLALALVVLSTGGPAVVAENEWGLKYPHLDRFNQGGARILQVRPRAERPRAARPAAQSSAQAQSLTPALPKLETAANVVTLGDSLADLLATGLDEAFAETPAVTVTRRIKTSSGLVRTDYHDWSTDIAALAAAPERIDFVVVMLGSNDRQQLRDEAGVHEPGSDAWKALYAARVDAALRPLRARNLPAIVVGAPPMRAQRQSADMLMINDVLRARVRQAGGVYVDLWEPFLDAESRYSDFGPSLTGEMLRLRTADGVHFTKAGARKAAHFVELEIRRLLDLRPSSPLIALPEDAVQRDPQLRAGGVERLIDEMVQAGLDPTLTPAFVLPLRPVIGPVALLTGAERAPAGALATAPPRLRRDGDPAAEAAREAMLGGRLTDWKAGRADDFRWFVR